MSPAWPNDEIWTQTNPGTEEDKSIFGEVYYKFLEKWTLTLGGRQYWLHQTTDYTADGFLNGGPTPSQPQVNSQSGFNPKVALSLQATDRPWSTPRRPRASAAGGAQANFPGCSLPDLSVDAITHIKSDTLWTYEVGTKVQLPAVLISAAAYNIQWNNLQQQVALLCGFYAQVNGQKARINGGEIEATGRLAPGLQFRLGLGYEDTDITEPGNLALFGVTPGTRVAGVPAFTASVGGVYTHPLNADTERLHVRGLQLSGQCRIAADRRWRRASHACRASRWSTCASASIADSPRSLSTSTTSSMPSPIWETSATSAMRS